MQNTFERLAPTGSQSVAYFKAADKVSPERLAFGVGVGGLRPCY